MVRLLYFSIWVQCSYALSDIRPSWKPEQEVDTTQHTTHPSTLPPQWRRRFSTGKRSDISEVTTIEKSTTVTPTWYYVSGEFAYLSPDIAEVSEIKRDLRAFDGYPQQLPLNRSSYVSPAVAVTSQLRRFQFCSSTDEECQEAVEMEHVGFDSDTQVFPAVNLIDQDTNTLCSIVGSDEAPTWALLFLSENVFIGHVVLHVSEVLDDVDRDRLMQQLRVSLEWFDMKTSCDPVQLQADPSKSNSTLQHNQDDYQLLSSCGGHIASRVFVHIDRHKRHSIPIDLTLSEIEIVGNPSGYSRLSIKSPPMVFNNSVANIYFKNNYGPKEDLKIRNFGDNQDGEGRAHIEHVLLISLKSMYYRDGFIPLTKRLTLSYNNGAVNVSLENCGDLIPVQNITLMDPPSCVLDKSLPPCSWTLVFLNHTLEVYIDKSLAGIFRKDLDLVIGNCSNRACERCMEVFIRGNGIAYYGNDFDVDTMEISEHIRKPKVLTSKTERHDFCYNKEITLITNCEDVIVQKELLNTTSNTLVEGFEALGVSEMLEEEFMGNYTDLVTQQVVANMYGYIVSDYLKSDEYKQQVEDAFVDRLASTSLLEEAELLKLDQINRHSYIFDQLITDHTSNMLYDVSNFFMDVAHPMVLIQDLTSGNSLMELLEKREELLDTLSKMKERVNEGCHLEKEGNLSRRSEGEPDQDSEATGNVEDTSSLRMLQLEGLEEVSRKFIDDGVYFLMET